MTSTAAPVGPERLVGHWPLAADLDDHSEVRHRTDAAHVELGAPGPSGRPGTAARFDGRRSVLEAADHPTLRFGTGDLTVAAWVRSDLPDTDVVGDIVSKFDPQRRRGAVLSIVTNGGVTSTAQANYRHLHFGIDDGRVDPAWTDCGRPGAAVKVAALLAAQGSLYAGTVENAPGRAGRLWRYEGEQRWVDLGNPVGCNAVASVVEFEGAIYCGTGRYIAEGSALGPTLNTIPGGKVFRLEPDGAWTECGHPGAEGATPEARPAQGYATGKADDVIALSVYRGALYCVSNHRCGVFRYQGGTRWEPVGLHDRRIMTLAVYRGSLYALINGGPVYRYAGGEAWVFSGHPEGSTQTYSAVVHEGRLYVGTWPQGDVFRFAGDGDRDCETWTRLSRVGYEREIMGMALYNGKAYLGALPLASVWRMDDERFTFMGTLDHSSAPLRRVWSLAVYQGRLFGGTLPSGHVLSLAAGKMASWDNAFPSGWHHVAAVKESGRLKLYVDGNAVAWSAPFHAADYDLSADRPLRIGAGPHEHLSGFLSDVRVYRRALGVREIGRLVDARGATDDQER
jgi:hypothetical protein